MTRRSRPLVAHSSASLRVPMPRPITRPIQQGQATNLMQPPAPPPVPSRGLAPHPIGQERLERATDPMQPPPAPPPIPSRAPTPRPTQPSSTTDNSSSPPPDDPSQPRKRRRMIQTPAYMREEDSNEYYLIGKKIPRLVHPFLPVHQLLSYGSLLYMLQNAEDDEVERLQTKHGSELELLDESDKETILMAYTVLIDHTPSLKDMMLLAIEDHKLMQWIEYHIGNAASQTHSDDTSALKLSCIPWIQDDLRKPLDPPLATDSKADRGFNHPVLTKMLCPGIKQKKLAEDPEYINELKLGNVSDEDIPTFCYESGTCDLEQLELGLFKGTFLLRTFRRIFTGPSSVLNQQPGPATRKKCNADIIGMTQVTLRSIAYAVVQARLTLSDKESWDKRDGAFNYRHFYESVVRLFENSPGLPWVEETLKWWNAQVFLPASHAQMIRDRRRSGSPTMFELINAQREKNNQPEEREEPEGPEYEEPEGPDERDELESVTESESD